jgi:hypothetical protein
MLVDAGLGKKDLKTKKFSFVVKNTFMVGTLQNLMEELSLSNENVIEINYFFALDKPKPEQAIPQEEWISHITHSGSLFSVAFFNGDVKLFDAATTTEKVSVK